jgi:hypothetical protein
MWRVISRHFFFAWCSRLIALPAYDRGGEDGCWVGLRTIVDDEFADTKVVKFQLVVLPLPLDCLEISGFGVYSRPKTDPTAVLASLLSKQGDQGLVDGSLDELAKAHQVLSRVIARIHFELLQPMHI